jgi:hypothetical protein
MEYTFETNKTLPDGVFARSASDSRYGKVYEKVIALPIVGRNVNKWMEIGGFPNKKSLALLQACLNPSVSKHGNRPRAYQLALMEQGAKIVSRRQEHKDGTFSLWVKKVSRDE